MVVGEVSANIGKKPSKLHMQCTASQVALFHLLRLHLYDLLPVDAVEILSMPFQKSASGGRIA